MKLDFLFYLQALRELSESYIENKNYDFLDELFSIQVEELLSCIEKEEYDKKYRLEVNFYLKYSGYDDSDFVDVFSEVDNELLYEESDDYVPSDWIDEKKFYKSFSTNYKKLKKEKI